MNNQATMAKMQEMRLHGMMQAFSETFSTCMQHKFTVDEMIAHLVDAEWDERYNRKFNTLMKKAAFRYKASIEEIEFRPVRKIDKNMILRLSTWSNKVMKKPLNSWLINTNSLLRKI